VCRLEAVRKGRHTVSGEKVVLFTLAEAPDFRDAKKK
jgi:hypothetical protein